LPIPITAAGDCDPPAKVSSSCSSSSSSSNRREKLSAEQNCQLMYNAESLGPVEYCRRQWEAVGTPAGKQRNVVPIVAMLTKLVERFDAYQYRVRENAPSLAGPIRGRRRARGRRRLIREAKPFSGKFSQENKISIDSNTEDLIDESLEGAQPPAPSRIAYATSFESAGAFYSLN
jgi:hypothetical protein